MKRLAVLSASIISVTASASNWVLVKEDTTGLSIYVDTDSISKQGGTTKVFTKHVFKEPKTIYYLNLPYNIITYFTEFDCTKNPIKHRWLSSVTQYNDRYSLPADSSSLKWHLVYPDSPSEKIANLICWYWTYYSRRIHRWPTAITKQFLKVIKKIMKI